MQQQQQQQLIKRVSNLHKTNRLINHVALVLDGSGSMASHRQKVVQVADEQIKHLMQLSEKMGQETRISVYVFDDKIECVIFDMDVMRLPSISDLYFVRGQTALIDALVVSQEDLATTSQRYGEHAFLTYIITDGGENDSKTINKMEAIAKHTVYSPENWSVGFLVPNENGLEYLHRCGVSKENIIIWDARSSDGMIGVGKTLENATTSFMTQRSAGVSAKTAGKSMFVANTGAAAVNHQTVKQTLVPIKRSDYSIHDVVVPAGQEKIRIDDFVNNILGKFYLPAKGYYQFQKAETIQGEKGIIVFEKATGQAYGGPEARQLIGLQWGVAAKVKPEDNPDYLIFVQSTSNNRNLFPGTKFLYMK